MDEPGIPRYQSQTDLTGSMKMTRTSSTSRLAELTRQGSARDLMSSTVAVSAEPDLGIVERYERCFSRAAADGQYLRSADEWGRFVKNLELYGLITGSDIKSILGKCPVPSAEQPLSYQAWSKHLMMSVEESDSAKELNSSLDNLVTGFQNLILLCDVWDLNNLGQEETYKLLRLLEGLEQLHHETAGSLDVLARACEADLDEQSMDNLFWSKLEAPPHVPSCTSYQFQRENAGAIEKKLWDNRVIDVAYRKDHVCVLRRQPFGIFRTVGNGVGQAKIQVEVVHVPRLGPPSSAIHAITHEVDAHRQLSLSPYFASYVGSNNRSHPTCNLFFFEHFKNKVSLATLLGTHGALAETNLLFRYWAREIIKALAALVDMTTFRHQSPIKITNVFISENGSHVSLGDIQWLSERPNNEMHPTEKFSVHNEIVRSLVRDAIDIILALITPVPYRKEPPQKPKPEPSLVASMEFRKEKKRPTTWGGGEPKARVDHGTFGIADTGRLAPIRTQTGGKPKKSVKDDKLVGRPLAAPSVALLEKLAARDGANSPDSLSLLPGPPRRISQFVQPAESSGQTSPEPTPYQSRFQSPTGRDDSDDSDQETAKIKSEPPLTTPDLECIVRVCRSAVKWPQLQDLLHHPYFSVATNAGAVGSQLIETNYNLYRQRTLPPPPSHT